MKAEELMIGDWVLYGEKPVRVLQLSEGKDYKYINPIPITPEILEKNFTRTGVRILSGTKTHYVESDDFYAVAINEYTDSIWELEYTNCEAHFPLVRVLVANVHELRTQKAHLQAKEESVNKKQKDAEDAWQKCLEEGNRLMEKQHELEAREAEIEKREKELKDKKADVSTREAILGLMGVPEAQDIIEPVEEPVKPVKKARKAKK